MKRIQNLSAASMVAALAFAFGAAVPNVAQANHPVLVEGELDFDGDGRIGLAEDTDTPVDGVFGTINAALAAPVMGGSPSLNQNGVIFVVTSGRFAEVVTLTGNVTLEGAPGVSVDIEAFLSPADPRIQQFPAAQAAPNMLQGAPGIVINAPATRFVTVRNVTTSNWTDGVLVMNDSRVLLDNVRAQNNINHGINVMNNAKVAIFNSSVTSTGFRVNPATGSFPSAMNMPGPGVGVRFQNTSTGNISGTTMSGNFAAGMANETNSVFNVFVGQDSQFFDNSQGIPAERQAFAACERTQPNVTRVALCFSSLRRAARGDAETPGTP